MKDTWLRSVDPSGRVLLPSDLCDASGWISGEGPLQGWLLMHTYRRLRLLSAHDVEASSEVLRLKEIGGVQEQKGGPLDFEEPGSVVLAGRILERQLARSTSGWRLTLPRNVVELWEIRPGNNSAAVLISGGYVEIWSIDALRDAYSVPLRDLIR